MSGLKQALKIAAAAGAIATTLSAHDAAADSYTVPVPKDRPIDMSFVPIPAERPFQDNVVAKKLGRLKEASLFIVFGKASNPPIGHRDYCNVLPAECNFRADHAAIYPMDEINEIIINDVNMSANRSINPMSDQEKYGKEEVWNYPTKSMAAPGKLDGDCEDYVIYKIKKLEAVGVSKSSMSIVVVRQQNGEGHAVLALHTSKGDVILDNLRDEILLPPQTGYKFLKALSMTDYSTWRDITIPDMDQEKLMASDKAKPRVKDPIANIILNASP